MGIRATKIRAPGILIRGMRILTRAMRIRAMAVRVTWIKGHLRRARMATTPLTPTDARPTATMDLAGSRAESLLASGLGAGVDAASMEGGVLADGDTTEAGRPFPEAEDFAVGSVTVTPGEAHVPTVAVDVHLAEVDAASVEAHETSAEVDVHLVEADEASAEVDVPLVEADAAPVAADMPLAEAVMVEAGMVVVGTGRLHH